jgi:DNA polymerase-2
MADLSGWLLDLYPDPQGGVVLWLLGDEGERHRLRQPFPVTFYAAGPSQRLRELWRFLQSEELYAADAGHPVDDSHPPDDRRLQPPCPMHLERSERRDLFQGPIPVLAARFERPADQPRLFRRAAQAFPDLTFYDADLNLALRHAAVFGTFPLARCQVATTSDGLITDLQVVDTPWELDPARAPLRAMTIAPEVDPFHAEPTCLQVCAAGRSYRLSLEPARPLLINLAVLLRRYDPDLLLTNWGDGGTSFRGLLLRLLDMAQEWNIPLPLNRDPQGQIFYKADRSYAAYGQIIYRGAQVHLAGRWHVDAANAVMFHDYGLEGVLEMARVTALPVQTAARVSPGTGISAMQIVTALRSGVLVPYHKQVAERPKTALELFRSDQGGMVYQPLIGLHADVAELDFVSMYPSIMARFNISPEMTPQDFEERNADFERGLIPRTLQPLLDKRLALKQRLLTLPRWDPRRESDKKRVSAHKWLLVTCFGYLGYRNARFGRIESHEAVTAYGRECLLRAKEAAEDLGGTVLHMYVDGLWVKKEGAHTPEDFRPMLDEIAARTGLPVGLDGIYNWVAFLPSRVDDRLPVANRYFGVFQDGSTKMRGIEVRRRDTPAWIAETQTELLECLAKAVKVEDLPARLPEAQRILRRKQADLRAGRVPLAKLVVRHGLSRELDAFVTASPAARAAGQLAAVGKQLRPGQSVRFLYTLGKPGVYAWDLPEPPDPRTINIPRYQELLLRAAETVLQVATAGSNGDNTQLTLPARPFLPKRIFPEHQATALPLVIKAPLPSASSASMLPQETLMH